MSHRNLVCDTTLLSYFAHGGIFHVLHALFAGRLLVPPTVAVEAGQDSSFGPAVAAAFHDGWLIRADMSPDELGDAVRVRQDCGLDAGEAEAVALAASRGMVLVCDERPGRAAAASLGVQVTGSMGVLYIAVETGILTVVEADRVIARMRAARQRLPVTVEQYVDVKQSVEADAARAAWLKNL